MANREAAASIAVFSSQANAPEAVPFSYTGDKAIVVLDADEPDPNALQLATMWARWVVRRKGTVHEQEIDIAAIGALIDGAARALTRHSTIRRCHSTAIKKINEAVEQVDDLVGELHDTLDRLRTELAA